MKKDIGTVTPLYPAPDLIVATYDENGVPNGMAAAWGGVCCSEPPCVAVAVRKERYTYGAISEREAFTVNIPSEDLVEQADLFGLCTGAEHDKFALTKLTAVKGTKVDAPTIEEFPISMECRLIKTVEIGSHVQFIGEVVACWVDDDCLDEKGSPSPEKVRPVIFMPQSGRYYRMGSEIARAYKAGRKFLEEEKR
jgi:flavin reductase (DIM6/NTAB) family NADH-FMN oxidoreductase RutF